MAKNFVGLTDTGRQRTNNEDTFIAEVLPKPFITACVIDGLGGYEGGEVAAALAREAIVNTLSRGADDIISLLKQSIIYASQSIQEAKKNPSNENYNHMACVVTLSLVDIAGNKFYYAHVGDTRLYLLRDKSLIKITKDQSFVGFLEDNGRLTEEEAMQHPKRNEINKALGFDMAVDATDYIETGESPFLPGDMLLLCSDGLTDMINSQTMTNILNSDQSLQQKATALVQSANDAGGNDNITVVLVQNDKKQIQQEAIKPASQKIEPGSSNESITGACIEQIFTFEKKYKNITI
jgi:serine/threonine protein phosphatase PrpC